MRGLVGKGERGKEEREDKIAVKVGKR